MKKKPLVIKMTASTLQIGGVTIVGASKNDQQLMIVMMKRHLGMEVD